MSSCLGQWPFGADFLDLGSGCFASWAYRDEAQSQHKKKGRPVQVQVSSFFGIPDPGRTPVSCREKELNAEQTLCLVGFSVNYCPFKEALLRLHVGVSKHQGP